MQKQFVIAIRVSNRFGVLTRVSAMFSRRGFNIDSLTVSPTETDGVSRITVTMQGDDYARNQMIKQLSKLNEVLEICEMKSDSSVIREMALVKIKCDSATRQDIITTANVFRANIIDYGTDSMVIIVTGESTKLDAFIKLMKPFEILEMCRTGAVALERGEDCLRHKDMEYINSLKINRE
ncbi:MAG: acetolactate synthase small subunit [Clostridia bacterium]|nr:acetolactate synthase small subunit [Clostridia bacterium]